MLVDAAIAVLPPALRVAITPASRRTLAAAAAGLVGRWSPAQVRQRLTGDLPASVKSPGGLLRHKLLVLARETSPAERSGQALAGRHAEQTSRAARAQTAAEDSRRCRDRAAAVYRAHPRLLAAVAAEFYDRPGAAAAPASVLLGTAVCRVVQAASGLDPAAALRRATADVAIPGALSEAAAAHAAAGLPEQVRAVHAAATSGAGEASHHTGRCGVQKRSPGWRNAERDE
ncbi:MAG TPA: hypothetical protein VMU51_31425 [Mycobacteriales bacterium]|nr:hypothetical protein [Mycobacteriales bacterium]